MDFFTKSEQKKLSDTNFLKELALFADSQRRLVEAEVSGFSTNPSESKARVDRATNDFRFFCRTYFPHYVFSGESEFHKDIYESVPEAIDDSSRSAKEAKAAPRGESKSTLLTQLNSIWCVVTGRKKFIVIIMDSLDQATMMLEAIKIELEFNPRLFQDFRDSAGQGSTWQAAKAITKNNVLLLAAGSGKKLRGIRHGPHRPDLVILDDIENDENVRNPDIRKKLEEWINKSILKLKGPGQKMDVFYVGTVLHYDSVLNRILRHPRWKSKRFQAIIKWPDRMDLWDQWEEILINTRSEEKADAFYKKHKIEMDAGAVVSWPDARPLLDLMKERSDDHKAFQSEMQNDPSDNENAIFKGLQYWVHVSDWVFYGAADPSLGKKNRGGDPSAILVGGWDKTKQRLDVVEADICIRKPEMIIHRIIQFQGEYHCILWGFEAVQFQEFCRTQLIAKSIEMGIPVPAQPVIPNTDKALRIESIEPFVTNGNIRSHRRHSVLNEQLIHHPEAAHDDGPDALEMLWTLASRNAAGIPSIKSRRTSNLQMD